MTGIERAQPMTKTGRTLRRHQPLTVSVVEAPRPRNIALHGLTHAVFTTTVGCPTRVTVVCQPERDQSDVSFPGMSPSCTSRY